MPVEMAWERHGVRSRFVGPTTAADLLQHVRGVCAHPDFRDLRFSILDFREAVDRVEDEQLDDLKAQLIGAQFSNPRIFVAAIATDPGILAHVDRFIRLGVLNHQIQVFATPEAAMDWIVEQTTFLLH